MRDAPAYRLFYVFSAEFPRVRRISRLILIQEKQLLNNKDFVIFKKQRYHDYKSNSTTPGHYKSFSLDYTKLENQASILWIGVAVISAKNHKRKRRKRQSVTAKREKSQTPKVLTAILTLPNLT